MRAALALLFLSSWIPAYAAAPVKKAQSRTLPELIALTLQKGTTEPLPAVIAQDLGFPGKMPARTLSYEPKQTLDGFERSLYVVLSSSKPIALVWRAVWETNRGGKFDAWSFRSSLEGRLEKAARGGGKSGDVWHRPVSITESIRAKFQKEVDFFKDK